MLNWWLLKFEPTLYNSPIHVLGLWYHTAHLFSECIPWLISVDLFNSTAFVLPPFLTPTNGLSIPLKGSPLTFIWKILSILLFWVIALLERVFSAVLWLCFFFFFNDFIYLFDRDRDSQRERNTSRGSGRGRSRLAVEEPDEGLDPSTPGSRLEPKADG